VSNRGRGEKPAPVILGGIYMKSMRKAMDILEKIIIAIVGGSMAVMVTIVVIAVIRRYLFGTTWIWVDELAVYCMIWATFLGVAVCFRRFDLVLLDFFIDLVPKRVSSVIAVIVHLASMAFIAYIFYTSLKYALSPVISLKISTGLGISMFFPFICIAIGFGCMFLFGLENIPTVIKPCKKQIGAGERGGAGS
jgi:C4-dicarboxylate transporter DctQ subunit